MAYTEKLLPVSDLFAAWQNRRAMELQDNGAAKEREGLQNRLLQEQVKAAEQQNLMSREAGSATVVPDKTSGMLTGEFGNFLNKRQQLTDMPGYVSGVAPAQYEAEQAALRQALASGSGWGGGGGGQTAEDAELKTQQASMLEEQAKEQDIKNKGYGGATATRLAEQMTDAKTQAVDNAAYDDMIRGARSASKDRWSDIAEGDKRIAQAKSMGNEFQSEIDESKRKEGAAGIAEISRNILRKDLVSRSPLYVEKSSKDGGWGDRALAEYEKFYGEFMKLKQRKPYPTEIETFLKDNVR